MLIDTGAPSAREIRENGYGLREMADSVEYIDAVKAIGVDPEKVKTIILTHLQWDHAWNLQYFPNATVYVQEREVVFALNPTPNARKSYSLYKEIGGPNWLITGCSGGIGKGIAKAVLQKGDNAVVTARNPEKLKELTDLTDMWPETAFAVALDVTDRDSILQAVDAAKKHFWAVDVLVNNAGYSYRSSLEEGEDAAVRRLFETNFFGPVELIKQVLPEMREKRNGAIINITSAAAIRSAVGSCYYAASKAALALLTNGLSKELRPLGIRVMEVKPGSFRTNFHGASLTGTKNVIAD